MFPIFADSLKPVEDFVDPPMPTAAAPWPSPPLEFDPTPTDPPLDQFEPHYDDTSASFQQPAPTSDPQPRGALRSCSGADFYSYDDEPYMPTAPARPSRWRRLLTLGSRPWTHDPARMIAHDPYAFSADGDSDWARTVDGALVPYRPQPIVSDYSTPLPPIGDDHWVAGPAVSDYGSTLPPHYESRPPSRAFDHALPPLPGAFDDNWCVHALHAGA